MSISEYRSTGAMDKQGLTFLIRIDEQGLTFQLFHSLGLGCQLLQLLNFKSFVVLNVPTYFPIRCA